AALAIARDLSEHMPASEALHQAQAELAHVTRVTTLGELAASIAHEVNQPLAAIVADANASLNRLAGATPELDLVRDALDAIVKDGHRAADVIQRIRQLATKTDPQKATADINDVIRDVAALVRTEVLWRRDRSDERRPAVRRLLYHEARRHGHGAVDQPLHHRRAWGTAVGDTEPQSWRDVSVRSAGDTMTPGSPTVVVVDDDAAVRDGLRRLISSVGLGVEVFPTAQAFLRARRPDAPGCLVLDVRLPGLSGLDLQRELADTDAALP